LSFYIIGLNTHYYPRENHKGKARDKVEEEMKHGRLMMYMKHETKGLVAPNIMKKIIRQESTKQMQKTQR
jgi:hypothetical protein